MRMLISTLLKKVPARDTKQRVAVCKRCGAKIYSLAYLKTHLEAHKQKEFKLH